MANNPYQTPESDDPVTPDTPQQPIRSAFWRAVRTLIIGLAIGIGLAAALILWRRAI